MRRLLLIFVFASLCGVGSWECRSVESRTPRWYRGNTHTHTLWSDGDAAPEEAASWYKENGYHFLVLSDHNVLSVGERWFPVSEDGTERLTPEQLDGLVARFGSDVIVRKVARGRDMRLVTLSELRERFEEPGRFLFLQGEEVTAGWEDPGGERSHPVHVNAVNIEELIRAPSGTSPRDVMNRCVDAIVAHGQALGRPVLAHVNHPNFGWGLTWQDVASVVGDRFFEVYNGHRGVRSHGAPDHPSTEEMWDRALTLRLTDLDLGLLYGVAVDDAHNYHGKTVSMPGRGWVVVRAHELDADAIVEAMRHGDFYASSGVQIDDFSAGKRSYEIHVREEPGLEYTTRFIGTRVAAGEVVEVGEVLLETQDNPARYEFRGDELYVRAAVVSSRDHPNPFALGDKETAWLQPVRP